MPEQDGSSGLPAFERVYAEQARPVRRFLQSWLRNSAAADDLTQETFLHFWRRPAGFDPSRGSIRSYLFGIARKKAADWRARKPAHESAFAHSPACSNSVLITDALNQLPDELRTVLWLREVEGYSYTELAKMLKIPVGTVRSRLHCARRQLRTIWMKEAL
jgi:RNA polymerase sigma-70 factor (ECF subfamily)